jgi:hypothetical protein
MVIIIIIIIYIIYRLLFIKGGFWSEQPVMRKPSIGWANMNSLPHFNIKLPVEFTLKYSFGNGVGDDINRDKIVTFIQEFFSNDLMMSYDNMLKHISNPKSTNVALLQNGELCATIHSRPVCIKIDGIIKEINYVEYLCVRPDLRRNNIASIMISSLVNRMNQLDFNIGRVYLFKKDGQIHNFIPFASSHYLCYEIEGSGGCDISCNVLSDFYRQWETYSNKHRFHLYIKEDEWVDFIANKEVFHVGAYVTIGQISKIKNGDSVYDIEYIIDIDEESAIGWTDLYGILKKRNIKYVTINDISDFKDKIPNIGEWKKGNIFQYYLYNAECPLIKKEELCFTIN